MSEDSLLSTSTISKLGLFYIINSIACIIAIMVLSIIYYSNIQIGADFYKGPVRNWQSEVVFNFTIEDNCTALGLSSVFSYSWPGTISGCDCNFDQGVRKDSCCSSPNCKADFTQCKGQNIMPIPGVQIDAWEVQGTPVRVCAHRVKNYSFQKQTPGQTECQNPTDFQCGEGTDNLYCVPTQNLCPIRNYTIADFEANITDIYEGRVRLTQTKYLFYTRKDFSRSPLVDFQIAEGQNICLKNSISVGSPGRSNYILLKEGSDNGCEIDDRFIRTTVSMGEKSFFMINKLDEVTQNLPGYDINDKFLYYNFYTSIFQLEYSCRDQITQIVRNNKQLQILVGMSLSILFFTGFFVAFYVIVESISCCLYRKPFTERDWYGVVLYQTSVFTEENKLQWDFKEGMFHGFQTLRHIMFFVNFVMIHHSYTVINQQKEFLQNLINIQCTDHYFEKIIVNVLNAFSKGNINAIMGIVTWMYIWDPTLTYYLITIIKQVYSWITQQKKKGKQNK